MQGCSVHKASDAEAALQILGSDVKLDLILTDLHVPGFKRSENLLQILKDKSGLLKNQICLISGDANTKEIALREGVRFLTKPISLDQLTGLL